VKPVVEFTETFWTHAQEELIVFWSSKATALAQMHDAAGAHYEKWDRWLGLPAVFMSTLTGSGTLATLGWDDTSMTLRVLMGLLMLLSAGLTAVHNFLGYGTVAERHRHSRNSYEAMRSEFDAELACPPELRKDAKECIEGYKERFSQMAFSCPRTPGALLNECNMRIEATKGARLPSLRNVVSGRDVVIDVSKPLTTVKEEGAPAMAAVVPTTTSATAITATTDVEEAKLDKFDDVEVQGCEFVVQKNFEDALKMRQIRNSLRREELQRRTDEYRLSRNPSVSNTFSYNFLNPSP